LTLRDRRLINVTPRPKPLTEANSVGNGTPATADLVTVQNGLFARLDDFRREMRETLREGREDHRLEHDALKADITSWREHQTLNCAALMAPYRPIAQAMGIVGWAGRHPKASAVVASLTIALSAIVGGLLLPGR
jgi:hypothetical protein